MKRTRRGVALLTISMALASCGTDRSPTAPSPAFVYQPIPQPSGLQPNPEAVTPNVSSIAGGGWGIITGTNFDPGATVTLGGVAVQTLTRSSIAIVIVRIPAHAAASVDLIVTNPDGLSTALKGAFTFAAPESFDVNGEWVAHAGSDFEMDMRFTIRNNRLVSVSCGGSAVLTLPPQPAIQSGRFSFFGNDGMEISGEFVTPVTAVGTITIPGVAGCAAARWWADAD